METNVTQPPVRASGMTLILSQLVLAVALGAGHVAPSMGADAPRPPAKTEFGPGPRASAERLYSATLEPGEPIRLRRLQTLPVRVVDAQGRPVDDASISVEGGMPEHRHGLPTQPRVSSPLGNGRYEIEGLRFSMGGWWELRLVIDSPAGVDTVTFNLDL